MATEIPPADRFTGLTRKVMEYSEQFESLVRKAKDGPLTDDDWAPLEAMVDLPGFQRVGMFLTDQVETIDWPTYRGYITQYAGHTDWDGKLRRITEGPNVVVQELEERNTHGGETDIANTVMIYAFNEAGKVDGLDVYVAHLGTRPA